VSVSVLCVCRLCHGQRNGRRRLADASRKRADFSRAGLRRFYSAKLCGGHACFLKARETATLSGALGDVASDSLVQTGHSMNVERV
jgi:hypothetical protein